MSKKKYITFSPNGDGTSDVELPDGTLYKGCYPTAMKVKTEQGDPDIITQVVEMTFVKKEEK